MTARSYTIVGVGAIGGYYGARLASAGHPVRWVARSDVEHLRRHGLSVTSPRGDVSLSGLEVCGPDDPVPGPTDVVVVATKAHDNAALVPEVARHCGPDTVVVVLQNGLDVERPLAEGLPDLRVLGAMSFICSAKVGPGRVEHLDYESVTVGAFSPDGVAVGVTDDVAAVVDDLSGAGVPASGIDDLLVGRWRKLVWNVPFNGLSVVLDAGTDELVGDHDARALVRRLMEEVVVAAAAHGHPLPAHAVDTMIEHTEAMTPYAPSMKLDHLAGRPLELGPIYDVPLATAASVGAPMTRAEALAHQLRFLDRRNRSAAGAP